jgi:N utilization substance protein B
MTEDEMTLVNDFFKKMTEEPEYIDYCTNAENGSKEKQIILFIFNRVIHKSPAYTLYVEDNFSECMSEASKINTGIEEILGKLSPENKNRQLEFPDSSGEEQFAKELLEKTIANNDRYTELIKPCLKNWDLDRIAHIDMILMKLALCELLCFEQIPVKVSINEYIDISKTYSTPRSKDFINGILDNIMHELRESKEIKKTGRGLVE